MRLVENPRRRVRRARNLTLLAAWLICAVLGTISSTSEYARGLTHIASMSIPRVALGVTHTEHSADEQNPAEATDRAKLAMRRATDMANQHIMGWGADSPSPSEGVRDWRTLDARMRLIASTGTTPVITLCCAPDWMKGGTPGRTDWSQLEVAPDPQYYSAFAALAADVARRYPQVKHFIVWNELKGFYDAEHGRWNIESYTELYNLVYRSLKAVDPTIKVGGPYVVMDSWSHADAASHPSSLAGPWGVVDQRCLDAVDYWLAHAAGADFIAVDGSSATKDAGLIAPPGVANQKFSVVTDWLRSRTSLPIWWAELYPEVEGAESWSSGWRAAVALDAILRIADARGSVVLFWQPEGSNNLRSVALWSPTTTPQGGQPQPLVDELAWIRYTWRAGLQIDHRWDGRTLVMTAGPRTMVVNDSGSTAFCAPAGRWGSSWPFERNCQDMWIKIFMRLWV